MGRLRFSEGHSKGRQCTAAPALGLRPSGSHRRCQLCQAFHGVRWMHAGDTSPSAVMKAATPELYRCNAFRLTGLMVTVSAREVARQADKLKMLAEVGGHAAHGLPQEQALAACTIRAAEILGLQARVRSLAHGKDADLALYDGDPLEITSHCVGVIIDGKVVSEQKR